MGAKTDPIPAGRISNHSSNQLVFSPHCESANALRTGKTSEIIPSQRYRPEILMICPARRDPNERPSELGRRWSPAVAAEDERTMTNQSGIMNETEPLASDIVKALMQVQNMSGSENKISLSSGLKRARVRLTFLPKHLPRDEDTHSRDLPPSLDENEHDSRQRGHPEQSSHSNIPPSEAGGVNRERK